MYENKGWGVRSHNILTAAAQVNATVVTGAFISLCAAGLWLWRPVASRYRSSAHDLDAPRYLD